MSAGGARSYVERRNRTSHPASRAGREARTAERASHKANYREAADLIRQGSRVQPRKTTGLGGDRAAVGRRSLGAPTPRRPAFASSIGLGDAALETRQGFTLAQPPTTMRKTPLGISPPQARHALGVAFDVAGFAAAGGVRLDPNVWNTPPAATTRACPYSASARSASYGARRSEQTPRAVARLIESSKRG
jgi:hypothetical protein